MLLFLHDLKINFSIANQNIDPTQATFVFLHGAGMDSSSFTEMARLLRHQGKQTLCVDFPAHGGSTGEAFTEISEYKHFLNLIFSALQLEKIYLVGHSMGALIALHYASQNPKILKRLYLIGCGAEMPVHSKLTTLAQDGDSGAADLLLKWSFPHLQALHQKRAQNTRPLLSLTPGSELFPGGRSLYNTAKSGILAADLHLCHSYKTGCQDALATHCPTLLLYGQHDKMILPDHLETLQQALPLSKTIILPNTGHMPHIEHPSSVISCL